ncbi:MAG TPA: serine hydrolase [Nocardioides sp.]|nr:serine hydrolase [Nocardioides sp.]
MTSAAGVPQEISRLSADAGIRAWVHAKRLGPAPASVDHHGSRSVPMASLYKLPLAACWSDLVAAGVLDPLARTRLDTDGRAPGPTGTSTLSDAVEVSQRDAVRLMLALSDNGAAEHLLGLVGLGRLEQWLADHGLRDTAARRGSLASWRAVAAETGGGDPALAPLRLADTDTDVRTSEYDAALSSATTAVDLVAVLALLWDHARHEHVRSSMRLQAWRHRVGSGFPHDDVAVHGKTGTLGRLRHEAAVVEFPGEHPVAVAVLTKSARPEIHQPRVDATIGEIARVAVTALRRSRD